MTHYVLWSKWSVSVRNVTLFTILLALINSLVKEFTYILDDFWVSKLTGNFIFWGWTSPLSMNSFRQVHYLFIYYTGGLLYSSSPEGGSTELFVYFRVIMYKYFCISISIVDVYYPLVGKQSRKFPWTLNWFDLHSQSTQTLRLVCWKTENIA